MASTIFKRNEIIILLGAGASVEAGIPDSNKMVHEIERLVSNDSDEWSCFRDLYRYIRSAIFYADGLDGIFGDNVPFNIERLVNVLDELHKKERHALYPFVGAWNPKLLDVAGNEFENVLKFRSAIIRILRNEWVALPEKERASYYTGLLRFQKEYEHPLRVFSLNYDLCVENTCDREKVQMGFDERTWDWRLFDETPDDPAPLILYKLHGSVDWYFDKDDRVTYSDSPSTIKDEEVALIFGTSYKLQYVDPFLFLAYELRRWTLDAARVIICIGYGFNDDHINGILQQSLRQDSKRKLLAVIGPSDDETAGMEHISDQLQLKAQKDQIVVKAYGTKKFLDSALTIAELSKLFPEEEELIPELPTLRASLEVEPNNG